MIAVVRPIKPLVIPCGSPQEISMIPWSPHCNMVSKGELHQVIILHRIALVQAAILRVKVLKRKALLRLRAFVRSSMIKSVTRSQGWTPSFTRRVCSGSMSRGCVSSLMGAHIPLP